MANWKGTAVPNSGLVEKVYFNTNLSISEVENIIINFCTENLVMDEFGQYIYFILANTEGTTVLNFTYMPQEELVILGLTTLINESLNNIFIFANKDYSEDGISVTEGWSLNEITINSEVISDMGDGSQIGNFNEELSSLLSITPFTQSEDKNILMHPRNADGTTNKDVNLYPRTKVGNLLASNGSKFTMPNVVYKQGGGTPVPNSGICPDIYLNTNLSIDEVKALLDTITYHDMGESLAYFAFLSKYIIGNTNYMVQLTIVKLNNDYGVALVINDGEEDSTEILFTTNVDMGGFEGWNTTFGNIINIEQFNSTLNNVYEEIGLSVGDQNDKLSSLFSITPFTSGGLYETNEDGTPNTDKPIQTGISEERVNELIDLKITGWLGGEY